MTMIYSIVCVSMCMITATLDTSTIGWDETVYVPPATLIGRGECVERLDLYSGTVWTVLSLMLGNIVILIPVGLGMFAATAVYACVHSYLYPRSCFSWLMSKCVTTIPESGLEYMRSSGQALWVHTPAYRGRTDAGNTTNHAHPGAANLRCQATSSLTQFCRAVGRVRFDVSTSRREKQWGREMRSNRLVHDLGDLGRPYQDDSIEPGDIVTMVDVDYYAELRDYAPNPMLIYTSIPHAVAGATRDGYYFCDVKDGKTVMTERVAGGASYVSCLWNYGHDLVYVRKWCSFVIYAVEKVKQPGTQNRYMVGLFPKTIVHMPFWLYTAISVLMLCPMGKSLDELERDRSTTVSADGMFAVMRHSSQQGDMLSFRHRQNESAHSMVVDQRHVAGLLGHARAHPKEFGTGMVERTVRNAGENTPQLDTTDCRLLTHFISSSIDRPFRLPEQMNNYICKGLDNDPDVKAVARRIHPSIVANVAIAPVNTPNNTKASIQGRILDVANTVVPPKIYEQWRREFIDMMFETEGVDESKGAPVSEVDVYGVQNNARQKLRNKIQQVDVANYERVIVSFQKREQYTKISDPRNISTLPTASTIHLSAYCMAFKEDVMNKQHWFVPGKKPHDVATQICEFVKAVRADGEQVVETDYSRFDGTISPFLREIEFMAMLRWIHPEHNGELIKLLEFEVNHPATTSDGETKYNTRSTRLSGSPLTTIGNSIINAFAAYCCCRKTTSGRKAARRAYDRIGPKYGDDGLDRAGPFEDVARDLGLTIKVETRATHVGFCGRTYIEPLTTLTSITPPTRILPRIPNVVHSDGDAGKNKILGYLVTESQVPLVGDYLRALARVFGYDGSADLETVGDDHDLRHRIQAGPYPYNEEDRDAVISYIADDLSVPADDVYKTIGRLQEVKMLQDFDGILIGDFSPITDSVSGYLVC